MPCGRGQQSGVGTHQQPPAGQARGNTPQFIRRHLRIAATLVVGSLVTLLLLTGHDASAQWLAGAVAAAAAVQRGAGMTRDLLHGRWGVDVLAVTADVSTVAVGEYLATLTVVLLLYGGAAMEDDASGRAKAELGSLLARFPQTSHRETPGGQLEDVAAPDIFPGDVLVLRPAEVVPVDGRLLSATGSFDESAVTAESLPDEYAQGDEVLRGSVNGAAGCHRIRSKFPMRPHRGRGPRGSCQPPTCCPPCGPARSTFTLLVLVLGSVSWLLSGEALRFAEVLAVPPRVGR